MRQAFTTLGTLLRDEWLAGGRAGTVSAPLAETITGTLRADDSISPPLATMLLGAGWVGPFAVSHEPGLELGQDIDFFPFPTIDADYSGAVEAAADIAVGLTPRPETTDLLAFLASPEAAALFTAQGDFVSPNRGLTLSHYPNEFARREAAQVARAPIVVPDLSDTIPADLQTALSTALQTYLTTPERLDELLQALEQTAIRTQG